MKAATACPDSAALAQLLSCEDGHSPELALHLNECRRCQQVLDELSEDAELRQWRELPQFDRPSEEGPAFQALLRTAGAATRESARETPGSPQPTAEIESLAFLDPPRRPGDLGAVGGYAVVGVRGRGGMGLVLEAWDEALSRRVALKVVRPGLADRGFEERVLREARAAAGLEHQGVVRLYGVERTASGLVCLVMEFVDGPTLSEWIRSRKRLDPKEAAELAMQAARGLSAAHAAGLVHRDVKPGNILLSRDGESPSGMRARIADFGLARSLPESKRSASTTSVAGTPEYMSPEQIESGGSVDARTDVYALGVTLYEMLTGEVPFRGTPHQVMRQILADEPRSPRLWNESVPKDLETVCQKALCKEAGRRYASAAELADDLGRWLAGEPILARPVGRLERAWRWCKRRPAVAALAVALTAAVAGGLAGTSWQWQRARAEAEAAGRERARALAEFERARRAVDRYFTLVSEDPDLKVQAVEPLRRRLLEQARDYYTEFVREHPDDPALAAELGRAYGRLGEIASILDSPAGGLESLRKEEEIVRSLHEAFPDNVEYRRGLALCRYRQAVALHYLGRSDECRESVLEARALWESLRLQSPQDSELAWRLMTALNVQSRTAQISGRFEEAEQVWLDARDLWNALRSKSADPRMQAAYALILVNWSGHVGSTGKLEDQESMLLEAVELCRAAHAAEPADDSHREVLLHALNELGICHSKRGQGDRAAAAWTEAGSLAGDLLSRHPANVEYRQLLASVANNLGILWHFHTWEPVRALAQYQQSLDVREGLMREFPQVHPYRHGFTSVYANCRQLLIQTGDLDGAMVLADRMDVLWNEAVIPADGGGQSASTLGALNVDRAELHLWMGHWREAEGLVDKFTAAAPDGRNARHDSLRTISQFLAAAESADVSVADRWAGQLGQVEFDPSLRLLAAHALAGAKLPPETAGRYDEAAAAILVLAGQEGAFRFAGGRHWLENSPGLDRLRGRNDFQRVLAGLGQSPSE
jgi:tetratricopeptide (TPR) repeat protein/tRNA A-37 threonylcarbamoyl transferase component Bud32